jgi:D-glycero-D-manno-heptose 1,7-bisphosphate phosphatase
VSGRPAVFVDRDGTLIRERRYLAEPEGVELIPGAVQALEEFRRIGLPVVIVTNQSGIARGLYSLEDYQRVAERVVELLGSAGVTPAAVEYCPHHPELSGSCGCRKPAAGMHTRAADRLGLDLARSYYVGDKVCDVEVVNEVGGTGILVRTGHGRDHESSVGSGVAVVDDLLAASVLIRRLIQGSGVIDPKNELE